MASAASDEDGADDCADEGAGDGKAERLAGQLVDGAEGIDCAEMTAVSKPKRIRRVRRRWRF
jgi:hypothetical protein